MNEWKFNMGQDVKLNMSGEKGKIVGRAQYSALPSTYMVRYVAADGRQCEQWFDAEAIEAAE